MSRRVVLIVVGIILAAASYLVYDYYIWVKYLEPDPNVNLYGWTDARGVRHYTDTAPPAGARDVKVTSGYKHRRLPWVLKAKEKIFRIYRKDDAKPRDRSARQKN